MTGSMAECAIPAMDLAGTWSFNLDPADQGLAEGWHQRALPQSIRLPGSLQEQGFGEAISVQTPWTGQIVDSSWFTDPRYEPYRQPGNIKVSFWLQPEKHYVGVAWYQREVEIPPQWQARRIVVTLERPHWATRLWIDDRPLGANSSLSTPHVYELGAALVPGKHRLTIRIDNRVQVGVGTNAHSITDNTQTNWNGIIGRMELSAGSPVWIADAQAFPDVNRRSVTLRVRIGNVSGQAGRGTLSVGAMRQAVEWDESGGSAQLEYALGPDAGLWDEFSPVLHQLTLNLQSDVGSDQRTIRFGLRELGVQGTQITLNGRRIFLRGTLECCIFPLTGYPPTDRQSWRRIIDICKAHGLNHIRFHSWCPPEAAFQVADELGFYLQIECAAWVNQNDTLGDGKPVDAWLYEEADRIMTAYGNHPSFTMFVYGNEPSGDHYSQYLARWVNHWKAKDSRRLYSSAAGWPAIPENQYHNVPEPRLYRWGEELKSRLNAAAPETQSDYTDYVSKSERPIVSHEIGQWCVYPNFQEIDKYTGSLKAKNFEIFRDTLKANHMLDQAPAMLMASGKLQALCYKEEIEAALRTKGFGGFQLLSLGDFPGQGTALVGVLDAFWDPKGYISAEQFRRFCNSTVPLARLSKRIWTWDQTLSADIEVAHFGPANLEHVTPAWRLMDTNGRTVASGQLPVATLPTGTVTALGTVRIDLSSLPAHPDAGKYTLAVALNGTACENDWDLWVFPAHLDATENGQVLTTRTLDDTARAHLHAGGTVLWMPTPEQVNSPAKLGFSSIFWNTAWTHGQAPHTLGILCDPNHPALAEFPTEFHSNWQWWELIHGASAMVLDGLPAQLRPIVQAIDTWFENRRLGLLYEATLGHGRLMVCSMDLQNDLEHRPAARQMRHSLMRYLQSEAFRPKVELEPGQIRFG